MKAYVLPGTTVVSDCWGYFFRLCNDGLTLLHCFFWHMDADKYDQGYMDACQG